METKERILNLIILIFFLFAAALAYLFYRGAPQTQFMIVLLTVTAYVLWGVWHHRYEGSLSSKIISEYILLGLLVILLFYFRLLF